MPRKIAMLQRNLIVIAITAFAVRATASAVYNFTNFDGPGFNAGGTTVNGINNNGQLAGFSTNNAATPTLFLRISFVIPTAPIPP
jgi:hypothetical protein